MPPLPPLRTLLQTHGLEAQKSLGQHFLLDMNINHKIVRLAGDLKDKTVLEVGPGPGGLTRAILEQAPSKLVAFEKDRRFGPVLEKLSETWPDQLYPVHVDALKADESSVLRDLDLTTPAVIISNLPYNIATPLVIKWLKAEPLWWNSAVLMFQKEVAERLTARPHTKAYGRLSVLAQNCARLHLAMTLPARAFTPPPKIDSAVVVFEPFGIENMKFQDFEALEIITQAAFSQRRKMLRNTLKNLFQGRHLEDVLKEIHISPDQRAETLNPEDFQNIARLWRRHTG